MSATVIPFDAKKPPRSSSCAKGSSSERLSDDDVYLVLWKKAEPIYPAGSESVFWTGKPSFEDRYYLTRFVWGHEDGGYRFDTREEACEAANLCHQLCHINVIDETDRDKGGAA